MNAQANVERAKGGGGGFITPEGKLIPQDQISDYIAKNPDIDFTQLRNAKTLKSVDKKEKDNDPYGIKAAVKAGLEKRKAGGGK